MSDNCNSHTTNKEMEDEFPSSVRKFLKSRSSILRLLHLMLPTLKKEPVFHYHVFYQYVLDHLQ